MKKLILSIFFTILILSTSPVYANVADKELQDAFITCLNPVISQAVSKYYKTPRGFDLFNTKILSIKRDRPGEFSFEVIVQISTFVGAHNPPVGTDILTIKLTPSSARVINYQHY
ncbi:DUF3888 domain-containing protein [Brevibacillus agri]|uniref:DUF3888 domain-containing protein n=1 Tax=Bacteria TaxID=2 RepID=UPI0025A64E9A|nr:MULTISPECIES: DUF3888 domain-containing protein [Brevibacillus]MED1645578.1 DUF3888 domain-containing protein [Brevibacillus agri]MED1657836.1 DUF3888 domain-containing protein [Brevibacillus agri]MED1689767.1 DUF3888 domain-containing protein [Brevibacillus agri]MED1695527.1 DUF3888 domain-containing protein [Brevibacillus agri]MED1695727.1 DUF3888 domain-containing protein [Brevibacillus agri]